MYTQGGAFYREYLRTDAWKIRTQLVRERAGYQCECRNHDGMRCNKKGRLEVHHLTYLRLGRERLADLIALCEECHIARHGHTRAKPQLEFEWFEEAA